VALVGGLRGAEGLNVAVPLRHLYAGLHNRLYAEMVMRLYWRYGVEPVKLHSIARPVF